jgi:membrane protein
MNKERLNYSLQDIYNLTNTIIPTLTVLSILVGGFTSFVYLNSLGSSRLLLDFSVQEFTIIFIAYFIYMAYFYLFMYSSSISYHIFLNKYKCSKNAKSILEKYLMLSILISLYILTENNQILYIKVIVSLILIFTSFYFLIRKLKGVGYIRNNLVKHLIFTFLLALDLSPLLFIFIVTIFKDSLSFIYVMFAIVFFLMLCELILELKYVADRLTTTILFVYPASLLFLFSLLISELSMSNNYNYFILISLLIPSLIGNYLLMKNVLYGLISSFLLFVITIFISSKSLNTHISYAIFSVVGMADNKQRAYVIDSGFLSDSNIILDYKDNNDVKYICSKALVISSKAYVFKLHNKVNNKPNFYQIPIDKVRVYQGEECQS